MMCKNQSSRWAATKALLVVPMVAVALSAFATTEYVPREVQDKVTENSVNLQDEEKPNPIVVVNGEKISYDEMSKIDPNTIHSMNVYKDYSKLPKELKISEDEAKNGVIVITLKKDGEGDANVAASEKMIVIADKRESGPQTQTQSSTVSILGNTDATEMTTVKVSTKDGEKPTIIINGEEVPYASLSDIQSDTAESMDVYKLEDGTRVVYIALESNTTKDGFETKKQEFEQKKQEFEQAEKQFAKADKDFKQAEKQFAQADKDFKQAEKQFAQAEKDFKQMEKDVQQQNPPYIKAEKMPKFRGGDLMLFQNWMQNNVQYPAEAIEKSISGRVVFSFVVEADGSLSSYQLMASPDKILADEVERVFNSSPREWTAGEQDGKKVRVKFTVPVAFMVQGDSGASKDFASLYAAGMDYIAKGDKLEKEVGAKEYKNQSDYKADMNSVNNYYKSAMSALESAYALNPQHKPTVQSLYMIAFRLRDESGMMAKYEKYKSALQSL